jgi:hypothetical protein
MVTATTELNLFSLLWSMCGNSITSLHNLGGILDINQTRKGMEQRAKIGRAPSEFRCLLAEASHNTAACMSVAISLAIARGEAMPRHDRRGGGCVACLLLCAEVHAHVV